MYASSYPGAARVRRPAGRSRVIRDPRFDAAAQSPAVRRRVLRARAEERRRNRGVVRSRGPARAAGPGAAKAAGVQRLIATTHGHEVGWAALPVARTLLRRIAARGRRRHLSGRLHPRPGWQERLCRRRQQLARLAPGVDHRPCSQPTTTEVRASWRSAPARAVMNSGRRPGGGVPVPRLVRRKGQDTLITAWPKRCRARVPGARLLIVGRGPYEADLRSPRRATSGVIDDVVFTGGVAAGRAGRAHHRSATSSPCRAAPAVAAWTSRGWASCTSRPAPVRSGR